MPKNNAWWVKLVKYLSLLLTGGGIGWLAGLSVSPVVSIIMTSVTGAAAAVVATMSGVDGQAADSGEVASSKLLLLQALVDPLPLACLVVGLVVGSYYGVMARTHDWLEPDIAAEVEKWAQAGLPAEEVAQVLFQKRYQVSGTPAAEGEPAVVAANEGVLFGIGVDECTSLLGKTDVELKQELYSATNVGLRSLPDIVTDPAMLQEIVERVLCSEA